MTGNFKSQSIGIIQHSKNVEITQAITGCGTQAVKGIIDSEGIILSQSISENTNLIHYANGLLETIFWEPVKNIEDCPSLDDNWSQPTITLSQIKSVETQILQAGLSETSKVSEAIGALGNAASILGGVISVSAIQDPMTQLVAVPLVLALAGAANSRSVLEFYQKIQNFLNRALL